MDETYERILLQLSETDSDDNTDLLRKIFIFLTFGKRPMTLPELAQAVTIDVGGTSFDENSAFHNPEDLLTLCQPLVSQSTTTGHLGFVHYSIQEFLLSDRLAKMSSRISTFVLDPMSSHTEIARICLSFLNYDDFAYGSCTSFEEFTNRNAQFPFLNYAASEWPFHATKYEIKTELRSEILKLLVPQKNPKAASMIQFSSFGTGLGVNVLRFNVHRKASHRRRFRPVKESAMNTLALAVVWGLDSVLSKIVESGADINLAGGPDGTALQCAALRGRTTTARILLDLGADVNYNQSKGTWGTSLMTAILFDRQQMIELLLEVGADVNVGFGAYYRPLNSAACTNNIPTMKRLIERGANVHYGEDKAGLGQNYFSSHETALGMAVRYGRIEAALTLLERGASLGDGSIVDMANRVLKYPLGHLGQPVPTDRVELLIQGLAALGHDIEVNEEDQIPNVSGTHQGPVKFKFKAKQPSSQKSDQNGA